ncbi:hypothetical protein [Terrimesophilobacter mesophilus]|uniref:Uncharacterized protein n=2 Tax=Terrimesophilobacter mesophilus TaxID=433647 RepID=A0A4R8VB18_9MICO|nr:hypothetical protein [Terrimesophilobacter mesophilus]TFB79536.1 hypothetical protein E3N84_05415 [Terrimesophilobacter mesophilus]
MGGRFAALAVIAALLLTGCVPGPNANDVHSDTSLFLGSLPAPATLPDAPDIPPFPTQPENTSNTKAMTAYNKAMDDYQKAFQANQAKADAQKAAVTKLAKTAMAGGEKGVAAWESLLVTAGISVLGGDGKPLTVGGQTGMGSPMTDADLRLQALLAATPGGLRLTDLADTLSVAFGMTGADLTPILYTELNNIPDLGFRLVLWSVGPGLIDGNKFLPVDQVELSWAQVGLIVHRLADEILMSTVITAGAAGDESIPSADAAVLQVDTASFHHSLPAAVSHRPCENTDDPMKQEVLNQKIKEVNFGFDQILETVSKWEDSAAATGAEILGKTLNIVRTLTSYANLLAKMSSIHARFSLSDPPLVRTKEMVPGEISDLTITYSYDDDSWGKIRECINSSLKYAGLEIPGKPLDAPSGIDVQLSTTDPSVLRVGDGKGGNKPVNADETDSNGVARFKLSGAPQKDRIPDRAKPKNLSIDVHALSDLKSSDFFKDVTSVPWDAVDAFGTGGLSLIPEMLGRTKFITFTESIPVQDWDLIAQFQASAKGKITVHRASNVDWQGCGGYSLINRSTDATSTFTTPETAVTAALLSNDFGDYGDQAFVFYPKGASFSAFDFGNGDGLQMFGLLAEYSTNKTTAAPATGDQPERKLEDCDGAGGGGGQHSDPEPQDCGVRTYAMDLNVTMPSPRHLFVSGQQSDEHGLWKNCGDGLVPNDPTVAPSMQSCAAPQSKGGKVPSIDDLFDPSKTKFTITGSYSCIRNDPGQLDQVYYNWTLTLCRIVDGKPQC